VNDEMSQLKVGIVGCGYNASRRIAKSYSSIDGARLVGACDIIKERADSMAKEYNVKPYYQIDDMLKSENLDIVSVCTSANRHYEPTMAALKAGAHVLVEKPLATNMKEGEEMVKKAWNVGRFLGVDFNRRHADTWMLSKEHIDKGETGPLCYITLCFQEGPYKGLDFPPYQLCYDLFSHYFDLCRFLGGEVARVYADLLRLEGRKSYNQAAVSLRFVNKASGFILGSDPGLSRPLIPIPFQTQHKEFCEIAGTKKTMQIIDVFQSWQIRDHSTQQESKQSFPNDGRVYDETFTRSIKSFVEHVAVGQKPLITGEDGIKALQLVEASIKSFETESPIKPY
jgi:UDP-N-acetylglucosamine 3-dehydrogenase